LGLVDDIYALLAPGKLRNAASKAKSGIASGNSI
jgi:hypothetical protein